MSNNVINQTSEVLMHFDLKLEDGSAADSTRVNNKPAKLVMGDGSLTPNFEACLLGLKEGEKKAFTLKAEDAFGQPNPDNIYYVDRSKFSHDEELKEGMIMGFAQPDGSELPGIIRSVAGDSVTVDFNHPLAGQTVIFDVEILAVKNNITVH
ncbi:FKBP-type peptidyl-prolyl cis-trans isomerase [Alteromonas oceanisediminis]|uniref:FKBP-type peptidyl-prolyl cis-trans isomerase n=1 Tax=Alteromonas oceanisediminis TaxID=2836180 RepID=UPI001BDAC704|nr:FKBP-type peptidyl-prolyl cis-trans isomerase [Alteromonas oceanisediminis]MBT0585780.1 FKBP-type peptidyl-prolyl cis-trans isomerase [Alteromonas oceanisediminis]